MAAFNTNPFYKPPIKQKVETPKKKGNNYLNYVADRGGCGHWRILFAEQLINLAGLGTSMSSHKMVYDPEWYNDVSAIKVQRQVSPNQLKFLQFLKSIQKDKGFKLIYELDDVVFHEDIPLYNGFRESFANEQIRQGALDCIELCDEMVVTNPYMRDYFKRKTGKEEISVIENFIPKSWFGTSYNHVAVKRAYEANEKRPRIVYAGAASHFDVRNQNGGVDDFTHVLDFVKNNLKKYQFVFIGGYPSQLKHLIQNKTIEFHPWKSLKEFPDFLASLKAQAFFAPLQDNEFNRCKSNIKFLESASLGIPCICQDMDTYEIAPNAMRFTDSEDLEKKLDVILKNKKKYLALSKDLRSIAEEHFLENPENVGKHLEAYDTPYGDPSRKYLTY